MKWDVDKIFYFMVFLVIVSLGVWFTLGYTLVGMVDRQSQIENAIKICENNNLEYITEHELIECGEFDANGELIQVKKFINNFTFS